MLSKSAFWATVFGQNLPQVHPFVFFYGKALDADRKPIFDRCVIGYGATEMQARANAEAQLYGICGHGGYHLGDVIPMV